MTRFWVSWWSGYYASEDCTEPPFQTWISGSRGRKDGGDELSICAVIDAPTDADVWDAVGKHFPDYEERFCTIEAPDFAPGNRFPGFENRTGLG